MTPENEQRHLVDPTKTRVISRKEWDFHKQVIDEQTKHKQYRGFVVLESNERGH